MKHLRETFTEEEFMLLLSVKNRILGKISWHDLLILSVSVVDGLMSSHAYKETAVWRKLATYGQKINNEHKKDGTNFISTDFI